MDFTSIEFLHSGKLIFKSFIFYDDILVLMKQVIDLKLQFRDLYLFSAEFIFELNELVLEFYSHFSLIIQIVFVLFFCLFELFSFIFKHKLNFAEILLISTIIWNHKEKYSYWNILLHMFLTQNCIQVYYWDLCSYFHNLVDSSFFIYFFFIIINKL